MSKRILNHYYGRDGIIEHRLNLKQSVRLWNQQGGNSRLKVAFTVIPIPILWFLWKRINIILHDDKYSKRKILWEINDSIINFVKIRFEMVIVGILWSNIVDDLQAYNSITTVKIVKWSPPDQGWFKGNTDGASRGNPSPSSFVFCIRDHEGNMVVAKGSSIHDTTYLVAEATAIKECSRFCKDKGIHQIVMESDS